MKTLFTLSAAAIAAITFASSANAQQASTGAISVPAAAEADSGVAAADEIAASYRVVDRIVPDETWRRVAVWPDDVFAKRMRSLARAVRPGAFEKHPRGPKRPPPRRTSGKRRHHFSTYRLIKGLEVP